MSEVTLKVKIRPNFAIYFKVDQNANVHATACDMNIQSTSFICWRTTQMIFQTNCSLYPIFSSPKCTCGDFSPISCLTCEPTRLPSVLNIRIIATTIYSAITPSIYHSTSGHSNIPAIVLFHMLPDLEGSLPGNCIGFHVLDTTNDYSDCLDRDAMVQNLQQIFGEIFASSEVQLSEIFRMEVSLYSAFLEYKTLKTATIYVYRCTNSCTTSSIFASGYSRSINNGKYCPIPSIGATVENDINARGLKLGSNLYQMSELGTKPAPDASGI
ncbi:hypothetical protein CHS0354_035703 [Potamilus streckersoni]|uniref:Uncharacterized protein n=1 Tax=Potamilus streckersoni TaxID=2493646 RepID=A0AAE0WAF2_9BIVA|nr:hypothetical protein CHS0354_035703 [Potamilus streckersoni]